jgi:hypothetical protein
MARKSIISSEKLNEMIEILVEKFPILSRALARSLILSILKLKDKPEAKLPKKIGNSRIVTKVAFELSQFFHSKRTRFVSTSELMSFGNLGRYQAAAQISNHVKRGDLARTEDGRYKVIKRFW